MKRGVCRRRIASTEAGDAGWAGGGERQVDRVLSVGIFRPCVDVPFRGQRCEGLSEKDRRKDDSGDKPHTELLFFQQAVCRFSPASLTLRTNRGNRGGNGESAEPVTDIWRALPRHLHGAEGARHEIGGLAEH